MAVNNFNCSSSSDSDASSWYSTILSSNDTEHEEVNKNQTNYKIEYPMRETFEYYQVSNPYAGSLWYSTTGDKGSEAIGKIQERVKNNRKRNVDNLVLKPRIDSLTNKKVDSPIKNEDFSFDDVPRDSQKYKGLVSNFPETKYRRAFEEFIESELKYHSDLELILSVYRALLQRSRKYRNILSQREEAIIFGNIDTVIDLSKLLIRDLLRGIKKEATSEFNEDDSIKDQISSSRIENFDIGETFDNYLNRFEIVYTSYFQTHKFQIQELRKCSSFSGPKVKKWLDECAFLAKSQSDCWNFESLLIKPIQRLSKYTLLIDRLLNTSCDDVSFEIIQHLCDAKAHLGKLLDNLNDITPSITVGHVDVCTADVVRASTEAPTNIPTASRNEYALIVKKFKSRFIELQVLKKEMLYSLPPSVKFIEDHIQFAESWQTLMDHGNDGTDEHFIKSIYSSYTEKLKEQRNMTMLMVNEVKETIVKALDLSIEYCTSVKTKINKHSTYRAAYINYVNNEKSRMKKVTSLKHPRLGNSDYADAQEYIIIENQVVDEVPVLIEHLDSLVHYTTLSYHRIMLKWLKGLAGDKSVKQMEEALQERSWTLGNNFDIIELHTISNHRTKMALEEFSSESECSKTQSAYRDKNIDATVRIYQSRVIRRLFGTF